MAKRKKVGKIGDIWNWQHGRDDSEYCNYHLLYLQNMPNTKESVDKIMFLMCETGELLYLNKHQCFQNTTGEQGYWEEWKYIS